MNMPSKYSPEQYDKDIGFILKMSTDFLTKQNKTNCVECLSTM